MTARKQQRTTKVALQDNFTEPTTLCQNRVNTCVLGASINAIMAVLWASKEWTGWRRGAGDARCNQQALDSATPSRERPSGTVRLQMELLVHKHCPPANQPTNSTHQTRRPHSLSAVKSSELNLGGLGIQGWGVLIFLCDSDSDSGLKSYTDF